MHELYYPYRFFPELRQSVRGARERCRADGRPLASTVNRNAMEHKVNSFRREKAMGELHREGAQTSRPPVDLRVARPHSAHIFALQRQMRSLQRGSVVDEMPGLQIVRHVVLQETGKIRRSLWQMREGNK